jgi:hypothetical protein
MPASTHSPRFALAILALSTILPLATPAQQPGLAGASQWKEPNGRYTISIPSGWKVDTSSNNLKITSGDNWAIFDTTSAPGTALDLAQKIAGQMQPMVSDWKVFNQGAFTTASHHPSAGVTVGCSVATKTGPTPRVMLFAAQGAGGGNYVTMTSSADQASAQATNATFMQIFESIRFAGE